MNNMGIQDENQGRYESARAGFEKAAAKGNVHAMFNLAREYDYGVGIDKNPALARQWYEKAAAAGDAPAKKRLAELNAAQ